jgi:proteasome lid subunit RPN8/RPN11
MREADGRQTQRGKAYVIASSDSTKLHRLALRAQKSGQREVCGIVVGDDSTQLELWFLVNRSPEAGSFQIGRTDYLEARKTIRQLGKYALGTFHSHPISEAIPAKTDIAGAALNSLCLIYDVCARQARLWRILKQGNRKVAKEISIEKKATRKTQVAHHRQKSAAKSR